MDGKASWLVIKRDKPPWKVLLDALHDIVGCLYTTLSVSENCLMQVNKQLEKQSGVGNNTHGPICQQFAKIYMNMQMTELRRSMSAL